jgi:hypothetical protein
MSESATYEFGSEVYCSDAGCGELLQCVVEPDLPRLTDLVVCSLGEGPGDGAARLVPPALAHCTPLGILLDCDKRAFDQLPATPVRGAAQPAVLRSVPDAQTRIRRGDRVHALDGDAGHVLGLIVRTEDQAITHVLLAAGRFWHRRHVAVPVDFVAGLGFTGLDVLLTKNHVTDFAL